MTTSIIESDAVTEAQTDVVESSPDTEAGPIDDAQKHTPVTGGGSAGSGPTSPGESGGEAYDSESDSGSGAENSEFEAGTGWEAPVRGTEATPGEEAAVDAAYAEADSQEFLQFLAPLIGPLLGTVLPAAAKSLSGSIAPSLLQRLMALLGQRPQARPGVVRRENDESGDVESIDEAAVAEAIRQLETVIGPDDRVQIMNTRLVPWKRICHLMIKASDGRNFTGTGWFIGPRTIATAGHCVHLHGAGGWANSIQVIPGRNGSQEPYGRMTATRFSSVLGWTASKDSNYDYGVIHLDRAFPAGDIGSFGYARFGDDKLRSARLNLAGYPGDKPPGTLWYHGRTASSLTPTRISYDIDTFGGQSGAPVWVRTPEGKRYAVGIHTNGSPRGNSATRINAQVFANLRAWSQGA